MERFSFSRVERWRACAWDWYCHYVLGRPEPPGAATELGKAVHAALAVLGRGEVGGPPAIAVARATEAALAEVPPGVLSATDIADVKRMVRVGAEKLRPGARIEVELERPLPGADTWRAYGFADVLFEDGVPAVLDWKTGRAAAPERARRQMALYAWLAYGDAPDTVLGVMEDLRGGRTYEFALDRAARAEVVGEFAAAVALIAEALRAGPEAFRPSPGHLCGSCWNADTCPAALSPDDLSAPFEELAGRVLVLERRRELLMERLRVAVAQLGPIEVGGEVFEVGEIVSVSYGRSAVAALLDLGAHEALTVDAKAVERLGLTDRLAEHRQEKRSQRFGHRRAKEAEADQSAR